MNDSSPQNKSTHPFLPQEKALLQVLRSYPAPFGIAFSGGADSTLLAHFAAAHLGRETIRLIHIHTPLAPGNETEQAQQTAEELGVELKILSPEILGETEVQQNGPLRCYYCKKKIMSAAMESLQQENIFTLCDGTNTDDLSDYRPGMKAADELGIKHPLLETGIGKKQIRLLARRCGIKNWMMPASACLASRIPCGTPLDQTLLELARQAEQILRERFFFSGCRVRVFSTTKVRIEVRTIHLRRLQRCLTAIHAKFALLGIETVEVASDGYCRGAMNP